MRSNSQIIDVLNELKDRENISLSELARQVGMAKSALSRYFNKTREFPLNRINDFAKVLHSTPEYILGFSNPELDITPIYNKLNSANQKDVYDYAQFKLQEQNSKVVSMPDTLAAHSDNINEELTPEKLQHNVDVTDEEIAKYIAKQKKDK